MLLLVLWRRCLGPSAGFRSVGRVGCTRGAHELEARLVGLCVMLCIWRLRRLVAQLHLCTCGKVLEIYNSARRFCAGFSALASAAAREFSLGWFHFVVVDLCPLND